MRALAEVRGETGEPVTKILARRAGATARAASLHRRQPERARADLSLLEREESDEAFADLEALLDQVTPYYKARVEEYQPKLQRAVIDAMALNWDPIASHDIAAATASK